MCDSLTRILLLHSPLTRISILENKNRDKKKAGKGHPFSLSLPLTFILSQRREPSREYCCLSFSYSPFFWFLSLSSGFSLSLSHSLTVFKINDCRPPVFSSLISSIYPPFSPCSFVSSFLLFPFSPSLSLHLFLSHFLSSFHSPWFSKQKGWEKRRKGFARENDGKKSGWEWERKAETRKWQMIKNSCTVEQRKGEREREWKKRGRERDRVSHENLFNSFIGSRSSFLIHFSLPLLHSFTSLSLLHLSLSLLHLSLSLLHFFMMI